MDAFALFEAVHCLRALREVAISGVEVQHIQLFAKCARAAGRGEALSSIKLSEEQSRIVGKAEWLREFRPSAVALSINATFEFDIISS